MSVFLPICIEFSIELFYRNCTKCIHINGEIFDMRPLEICEKKSLSFCVVLVNFRKKKLEPSSTVGADTLMANDATINTVSDKLKYK